MILLELLPSTLVEILYPIGVAVIAFLIKLSISAQKDRIDKAEKDNGVQHGLLWSKIDALEKSDKDLINKMNEVNLKILEDIKDISIKIAEFKRNL
jgi:hypothetical protein